MPSVSGVLTWETTLSSTQRMEMGILAPRLSHNAVTPHLTPITPVRFEYGVIRPGMASMIRELVESLISSFAVPALNALKWAAEYIGVLGECVKVESVVPSSN